MELVRHGLSGVFMINYLILLTYTFIDKLPEDYIRIIGYICVGLLIVFISFIVFIKLKLKGGFGLLNFEIFFSWIFIYFYAVDISSTIFNVFSTEFSEIFSYLLILIFVIILICSEIYLRYGVRSKVKIKDKNNIILLIVKIFFLSCLGVILFYIFHQYPKVNERIFKIYTIAIVVSVYISLYLPIRCIVLRIDNIGIRYVKIISLIYFFVGINILYFNIKELKYENLSGLLIGGIVLFMGIYNYIYCNIINKYQ